jgi:hypothetical protein
MTDKPSPPELLDFKACPYCTFQVPAEAAVCPHCTQSLPAASPRAAGRDWVPAGGPPPSDVRRLFGKRALAAVPVLLALVVLVLVYGRWSGHRLHIVPDPTLPIEAAQEKRGGAILLTVAVTNEGEDVPDLSLMSIGVAVEIVYRDGRRTTRTVFPKSPYRGEGALLRGETGRMTMETPAKGVKEIVLRSEVIDLGAAGRGLIRPGRR